MPTYAINDLGTWTPYTPTPLPEWAAQMPGGGDHIAFLRRASDGEDFYAFRNTKPSPLDTGAVFVTTLRDPSSGHEIVKSAFRDPTMVFPLNQRLLAIFGVDPSVANVQSLFAEQVYDPATRTLSPPLPPPPPSICSKLGLKRALGDRWPAVKAAIEADASLAEDWDLAVQLKRTDPLVKKMQATLGLTDDQVTALIIAARAAVA